MNFKTPNYLETPLPLPKFFPISQWTLPGGTTNKTLLRNENDSVMDPITEMGVAHTGGQNLPRQIPFFFSIQTRFI